MQAMAGTMWALGAANKAPVIYPWYQAGGTIALANVKEWVENPTSGQLYAGGTLSGAWTIAFQSAYPASPGLNSYAIDSQTGRVVVGVASADNGFYAGAWKNINLFADTNTHVLFIVSDGSSIQAYRDNVAISTPLASTNDFGGGTTRWRRSYTNDAGNAWESEIPKGAIYNIAIDSTQRAALYTSMNS